MKKFLLTSFLLFFAIIVFATDNIFTGTTNHNWGTATNWSQGTVPTAIDGYWTKFDGSSPDCTLNSAAPFNKIDCSAYTGTWTVTNAPTASGAIILGSGMHVTGTSALVETATATITSNGFVWPNSFTQQGASKTITFADKWVITKNFNLQGTTAITLTGDSILVGGNVAQTTTAIISGTNKIRMNGTGTWSNTSTGQLRCDLVFNTAGTITIGNVYYGGAGKLQYVTGSISITAGTTIYMGNGTLDLNGVSINNLSLNVASSTTTLASGVNIAGTFSDIATAGAHQILNSSIGGTQRTLTMLTGSTVNLNYLNATDIDSHLGNQVIDVGGILSNTLNWYNTAVGGANMFFLWGN
jgi:hypothetical protein